MVGEKQNEKRAGPELCKVYKFPHGSLQEATLLYYATVPGSNYQPILQLNDKTELTYTGSRADQGKTCMSDLSQGSNMPFVLFLGRGMEVEV